MKTLSNFFDKSLMLFYWTKFVSQSDIWGVGGVQIRHRKFESAFWKENFDNPVFAKIFYLILKRFKCQKNSNLRWNFSGNSCSEL